MNDHGDSLSRYECIRRRWDREDDLLVSRTGLFLTANSIFCAASQLQQDLEFKIGVAVVSLIISFLWLTTSWHSFNIIARLYREAKGCTTKAVPSIYEIKPVFVRPNTVFGKLLPGLVILAWIVYLTWCLRKWYIWAICSSAALLVGLVFIVMYAERLTRKLRQE